MSVLIKGVEMPKDGDWVNVNICSDGSVYFIKSASNGFVFYGVRKGEAIEIPPHGRLIDADAFVNRLDDDKSRNDSEIRGARRVINQLFFAPTIIEAEGEE